MLLEALANRAQTAVFRLLGQARHVRWRRRGRCAEQIVEQPVTAQYRRCSIDVGGHCENAAFAEETRMTLVMIF